jgi:hypothetical protein
MRFMGEDYEDRIDAVATKLTAFAMEHCQRPDGQFDALLLAMAAAQFSGSNFSLLPATVARDALMLTNDRLGGSYLAGKRIGETN